MQGHILFGGVNDRPWGMTLGALWLGGLTGHLTVGAGDDAVEVTFERGNVVAATSPFARDSAIAVGVAAGLVPRAYVDELRRQLAARPGADDIDVVAARLDMPAHIALRLRRLVLVQRAARTFAYDGADFIVDDRSHVDAPIGCMVDTRAVVHWGARHVLAETQLIAQLALLGTQFQLADRELLDTAQFGFSEPLPPGLLDRGCALGDLADHAERAMVYALVCCGVLDASSDAARHRAATGPPNVARTRTLRDIMES